MNSNFPLRLKFVAAAFVVLAFFIIAKLFLVQIVHHDDYASAAIGEYTSEVNGLFDRGTIYFTQANGTLVPAATLNSRYKLVISPIDIKPENRDSVYASLNAIVPIDRKAYDIGFTKPGDQYEVLADRVSTANKTAVMALKIKGVRFEDGKERFYPGTRMAAQTLGFVGFKGDELVGRYGLERQYNDVLSRSKGDLYVNFFAELFTNLHKTLFRDPHSEGDIVATIEPEAQHALETTLADVTAKWGTDKAGGIIIDPRTGDILAMAGTPNFDPGNYGSVKNIAVFQNPNVEDVYELGSIIKALTMAAGLDAGVITEETTYNDTGCMTLNTKKICNFDKVARNITPMQTILDKSLNMGATFIMQRLGKDTFREYFTKFGLTEKSGVDMPGEVNNIVTNLKSTREVEYATASFGQGIALTPVAAVRAFSPIANDGLLVSPRVVKSITYADGFVHEIPRPAPVQVLKPETAATVTRMLVHTVDTALLGGTLKLEHYAVAAKTGTAQMAREDGRGYYADQYLHSMFGYYPAYNPRFLVLVYGINPKGVDYSSQTMAVPFMNLAKFLLTYYDVAPDR